MPTAARILLILAILLITVTTPVQAYDEVPVGGIAIIGFNFDDPDEFSFVCTTAIPDGTEIRFTDKGWTSGGAFLNSSGDGLFSWYTPGGCAVGQIVTINVSDFSTTFILSSEGDQILVYQFLSGVNHFIFALNSRGSNWQATATSGLTSALPTGLDSTNSIALQETDNAIYKETKSFNSVSEGLAYIVDKSKWTPSDDPRLTMPTGTFSFGPTAIHLSTFTAQSDPQPLPLVYLAGLLVLPVVFYFWKNIKQKVK